MRTRRLGRTRTVDSHSHEPGEDPGQHQDPDAGRWADSAPSPDWRAATSRLSLSRRAGTTAMWAAVACGPLALVLATAGTTPAPIGPTPAASFDSAAGPAGFAQLFLAAYLPAGAGTEDTVRPYYPPLTVLARKPATRAAAATPVLLRTQQLRPDYWSITTAVQVLSASSRGWVAAGLHCYQIPVLDAAAGDGTRSGVVGAQEEFAAGAYVAASLPQEVACPAALPAAALDYGNTQIGLSGPAPDAVGRFLAAYLAGQGELSRYTAPGRTMNPVMPPAYSAVTLRALAARGPALTDPQVVPVDGTSLQILADIEATDTTGQPTALTYALTLTARAGRWEVSAIDAAPVLAGVQAAAADDSSGDATPATSPTSQPTSQPTGPAGPPAGPAAPPGPPPGSAPSSTTP